VERQERPERCNKVDNRTEERKISKIIFDTDVLIWYFRGNQNARDLLANVPSRDRLVSSLCIMELIQGCLDKKEVKTVKEFVKENFPLVIHPDEKISENAIELLEKHALSDGLGTIDALIASSVLLKEATFVTANYKHFKNIPNLNIQKFDPLAACPHFFV